MIYFSGMEKLNKEDIYVPLEGKSKVELAELEQITCLSNLRHWNYIHFDTDDNYNKWDVFDYLTSIKNKAEVTIQQLKEILQPMETKEEQLRKEAKERGFVNGVKFYCLDKKELVLIDNNIRFFCPDDMYDQGNYGLHVNGNYIFFKW
mgnify:CR=1 FL=1